MIMDNLPIAIAGLLIPVATQRSNTVEITNSSGSPVNVQIYGFSGGAFANHSGKMQIGKGSSIVTRQDFVIESPFTNGGIEDSGFINNAFGYVSALGEIQVSGQLAPTFGSGTITEVTKTCSWSGDVLIFHDVGLSVGFISAEQVNVAYTVLI